MQRPNERLEMATQIKNQVDDFKSAEKPVRYLNKIFSKVRQLQLLQNFKRKKDATNWGQSKIHFPAFICILGIRAHLRVIWTFIK